MLYRKASWISLKRWDIHRITKKKNNQDVHLILIPWEPPKTSFCGGFFFFFFLKNIFLFLGKKIFLCRLPLFFLPLYLPPLSPSPPQHFFFYQKCMYKKLSTHK